MARPSVARQYGVIPPPMHGRRPMARARFMAAAAAASVIAVAQALPILAASASLTVSPISGGASAAFSATYTFSANRCNNQLLEIRWNSPTGKVLRQVPYPTHCGTAIVSGLYPPTGSSPGRYAVWGDLVLNGAAITGTQASAAYTVSAPPVPSPSPKPSVSAGPAATATTTATLRGGSTGTSPSNSTPLSSTLRSAPTP